MKPSSASITSPQDVLAGVVERVTFHNPETGFCVLRIKARGHRHALPREGSDKLAGMVAELAGPGDYVVFLGAGNITQWAYALPAQLAG